MALFGSKKNKKEDISEVVLTSTRIVLARPHITEKATLAMDNAVYTFEVEDRVTKNEIKKAVKAQYGVDPVKVRTVKLPTKTITRGKNIGTKEGMRKAYVYLKKGDKIELF